MASKRIETLDIYFSFIFWLLKKKISTVVCAAFLMKIGTVAKQLDTANGRNNVFKSLVATSFVSNVQSMNANYSVCRYWKDISRMNIDVWRSDELRTVFGPAHRIVGRIAHFSSYPPQSQPKQLFTAHPK